jgi:hypothetical protein
VRGEGVCTLSEWKRWVDGQRWLHLRYFTKGQYEFRKIRKTEVLSAYL